MSALTLSVAPALAPIVRPGALAFEGLRVLEDDPGLDKALADAEERLRQRPHDPTESTTAVRAMYRKVGLDPTRRRPSSEALLRRVLKGDPLPRVNTLVDIGNWCSVECQLPYGVYDLDRVEGPVSLRLGEEGEEYQGIRRDAVHVGGRLVVADALGAFGNPTADSARTMVTPATARSLIVIFAPAGLPPPSLGRALALTAARVLAYAKGRECARLGI
ncbi:MAG TPA: phenylalanine--tRNA ligase beta subunit-related protein [Vicinamibacterales bacterium]|nr:phenylalanine--tRNA ligase beta subunit-related protein [Vicinamibacterales bacterium]